ncbi:MAG: T9SS type A sorting domain-containing protein [Candidatus Eisenbacteria bacterium]|nr:T9SS type A sorting domain-containing protein [Candidatus Eisenbacteria bacterium]
MAVDLPAPMQAEVAVMDIQGRRVRTIVRGLLPAGRTTATWDGRGESGEAVRSGVYFVRLACQGNTRTARLVLLR